MNSCTHFQSNESSARNEHSPYLFNSALIFGDNIQREANDYLIEGSIRKRQMGCIRFTNFDVLPTFRGDHLARDLEHSRCQIHTYNLTMLAYQFTQMREVQPCATGQVKDAVTQLEVQSEARGLPFR